MAFPTFDQMVEQSKFDETVKSMAEAPATEAMQWMMDALRFARDNQPIEWDALMATEAGARICTAWSKMRSFTNK